ncbi:hypothetical protein K490DRAFT_38638 [Saccharata proteae CBS 121410]|uniref:SH3 domain-containing protein n=1 Tax=Saccharata proteae CBS 121410 TaxID=1314787 RepID=A0A6A5YC17_9PEZI|nr:hypothetical protein K490DRAFT_38638 [Saccharata proteae CBS 121410]
MAQSCVSLAGSSECSAFNSSSISTDSNLTALFPFLSGVSDTASFDDQLRSYISGDFVSERYTNLLGCTNINLSNTTEVYARYTTSVLCNAIVQNSIDACSLTGDATRPLCADTCAEYAESEQSITASPQLCDTNSSDTNSQIRADFTNCALPADSLSESCIEGVQNEPNNCGFSSNLMGLCSYCAASSSNATDSCCVNSDAESRCSNVRLPTSTSVSPLFPSTTATGSSATSAVAPAGHTTGHGLSAGAIAGIVIGSILGAALLLSVIICACVLLRRRRQNKAGGVFNQPSPSRAGTAAPSMTYADRPPSLPPGRVARMAALEETSSSDPYSSPRNGDYTSNSDGAGDSPQSRIGRTAIAGGLGTYPKRDGSLCSSARLGMGEDPAWPASPASPASPNNGEPYSPDVGSGQSEQLPFFKDYYSEDEIHPNDTVATLWAYQPRANDEFELERGDMVKVVGIWDDGWATGVKLTERADEYEAKRKLQRDSGVSSAGERRADVVDGEIKAFPLVCVCLPQHWKKTIDGDPMDPTSP